MTDGKPDESNDKGEKVDTPVTKPEEPDKVVEEISPLDRAEAINKEKKENLILEKELLDKREKLMAEEKVGGRAKAGTPATPEEIKEAEHQARVKRIGQAAGAQWAKD